MSTENDFEIDQPIRLSTPDMSDVERSSLLEAFDANAIDIEGTALEQFERSVADHTGTSSAVAVVSTAAALHLGLRVLGVVRGDTVLMPTMTHIASGMAIRRSRSSLTKLRLNPPHPRIGRCRALASKTFSLETRASSERARSALIDSTSSTRGRGSHPTTPRTTM